MLGAVLREVQLRFLEDGDEVGEALHLAGPFAEFVWVVEVRKISAGQAGIGVNGGAGSTCVLILLPMSLSPLRATMSLKLAPFGIVTGGAKSSVSPYLSDDIFDEQHEQDVVLVLTGIHATAQLIA